MKIIETENMTNEQIITAVVGAVDRLKDVVGEVIPCGAYLIYEDEANATADENSDAAAVVNVKLLCFYDAVQDSYYTTNSATVMRTFAKSKALAEQLGVPLEYLEVITGKSAKGRDYIDIKPVFDFNK